VWTDGGQGDGIINTFAFGGGFQPRSFAARVIDECHEAWRSLHLKEKRSQLE
jgi:hypothetical protein